ncbi:diacylglycerol kinase family protein [Candidatus Stoquefichus massiliensis]|uniref:diacylglycerol kinase family protein n=1 Tax=Candidatus Stoquefichus massiliensis TaxID=1470350 RepID=UPI0009DBD4D4|nr:diacylglycerol kinase family protein [Candidatus Stoquefichus massiliensis]
MKKAPFYKSVGYAWDGIFACLKKERNMKIHLLMMLAVIICGFIFCLSIMEWIVCVLLFGFVISLEILNTAIEAIVDMISPEYHPLAKLAKDAAAGAVLVSALMAAIIGLMIFIPKLLGVF